MRTLYTAISHFTNENVQYTLYVYRTAYTCPNPKEQKIHTIKHTHTNTSAHTRSLVGALSEAKQWLFSLEMKRNYFLVHIIQNTNCTAGTYVCVWYMSIYSMHVWNVNPDSWGIPKHMICYAARPALSNSTCVRDASSPRWPLCAYSNSPCSPYVRDAYKLSFSLSISYIFSHLRKPYFAERKCALASALFVFTKFTHSQFSIYMYFYIY